MHDENKKRGEEKFRSYGKGTEGEMCYSENGLKTCAPYEPVSDIIDNTGPDDFDEGEGEGEYA